MTGSTLSYTGLITSQHADKPKFMAMVSAICQPFADLSYVYQNDALTAYDLDTGAGAQLDKIGKWIGPSRVLNAIITGVFFAFDTAGLGFDQGIWLGPYDSATGLSSLPDDHYRAVLKAQILNNKWDGTMPTAYAIGTAELSVFGYAVTIIDYQNMTMGLHLSGGTGSIDALTSALLTNGYFNVRPMGVTLNLV
jgi:hypothetical protein